MVVNFKGKNNPFYGKKHSEETKRKISEAGKGRIAWNNGLTKETNLTIMNASKKLKGREFLEEHKNNISKGRIGIKYSEEGRKKLSIAHIGKNNSFYGKIHSKETREKISIANKNPSEETREKLSKAHKGKIFSEEHRRKIGLVNKGKIISKETRMKISLANKGKIGWNRGKTSKEDSRILNGDKCFLWNGGKSFEPYGIEFNNKLKEFIRKRDNYRCQQCFRNQDELFKKLKNGKINKEKLSIHHIDFNKKNNNPNNLIALCRNCHSQTSFNRESWTNYFQDKIIQQGGLK